MNNEERPNPDELLQVIRQEEALSTRGCLKVFLGMAAGVGKTYSMLEAAHKLAQQGINVVVGIIDTHGRKETEALLAKLPSIPEKAIVYKDTTFLELDIDAVLKAKPKVVLIDELAHSNVPGSRHNKRWQDVIEILDNGIDVYTTLNVQHIESLKDFIESIAGIPIRETVPDSIIESAEMIELIDITPKELLQRLKDGKVYLPIQSKIAAKHFFQEDRLTALREVLLRYAAEKVDHDLHGMMSTIERTKRWTPRERLLVAIGHSANAQKLIRTARRLAFNLNAPWIALHVDDGSIHDEEDLSIINKSLTLARELGAEVITKTDPDVANAIEKISRQKGVTQILIGRQRQSFFGKFFGKSIMDQLTVICDDIDIHVICRTDGEKAHIFPKTTESFYDLLYPYVSISLMILIFTVVNFYYIAPIIGYRVAGFFFLLCILSSSLFFKKGPIFFASLLYGFIWRFTFVPIESEHISITTEDEMLLLLYLLTAIITGVLTDRSRKHQALLERREQSIEALYVIVKEIAMSQSTKQLLLSVRNKIGSLLDGVCEIVVKKMDGSLSYEAAPEIDGNEVEKASATWVYENHKEAGISTDTLSGSRYFFTPLKGYNEIVGVLAYHPNVKRKLSMEEQNFLHTVGHQLAIFLEKTLTEERHQHLQYINKTEKIYQSIFSALSGQLQVPLTKIQKIRREQRVQLAAAPKLMKGHIQLEVYFNDLENIVESISAMAELGAGLRPIHKSPHTVKELIESSQERWFRLADGFKLIITIDDELPILIFDIKLMSILLTQLIVNATENSASGSEIHLTAKNSHTGVILSVTDEGRGIPAEMLKAVFEKFYKVPGSETPGLGLGLSIAFTIAEIHGGSLTAENNPTKGACISMLLPAGSMQALKETINNIS